MMVSLLKIVQFPVFLNFDAVVTDGDYRFNIYKLLVEMFSTYPGYFEVLLRWYEVDYAPSSQYPSEYWFDNMPQKLKERSTRDLIIYPGCFWL